MRSIKTDYDSNNCCSILNKPKNQFWKSLLFDPLLKSFGSPLFEVFTLYAKKLPRSSFLPITDLMLLIRQDVDRTIPEVAFFQFHYSETNWILVGHPIVGFYQICLQILYICMCSYFLPLLCQHCKQSVNNNHKLWFVMSSLTGILIK